jgi:PAS domain S-box-containing protein
MNITKKILIFLLVGALLVAVIVGSTFYIQTHILVTDTITTQHLEIAGDTMDKVDRYLFERYNAITAASIDTEFEKALAQKTPATPAEEAVVNKKLDMLARYTGPWDKMALIGTDGVTKYSLAPTDLNEMVIGTHISAEDFTHVVAGDTYYSDVIRDNKTGQPTMVFAAPVRDESKQDAPVIGVIMGHLTWNAVLSILHTPDDSFAIELFNKKGIELGDDSYEHEKIRSEILHTDVLNHPAIKAALNGLSGSGEFNALDEQSENVLLSYVPEKGFGAYTGNGWVMVVQAPVTAAFRAATDTALAVSCLFGLFVIFVVILSYSIIRRTVLTPLLSLTRIASQFGQNDFSQRVLVKSKDEIAQLATAFNDMANSIQVSQSKLESRVQDRTRDLNETNRLMTSTMERVSQLKKFSDEQSALYQLMLESIGDAVLVLDKHKIITLVNSVGEHLLARKQSELIGKKVDDIIKFRFQDDSVHFEKQEWSQALGGVNLTRLDIGMDLVGVEGKPIPVSATISPIVSQNENIGTVITIRDVREERALEETRISFISVASHQLRTPLTSMRWFSEMLLEGDAGPITDQQRHFVQSIYQGTDRMINLVSLLLQIARVEGKRLKVDPKPTNLRFYTNDVVLALRPMFAAKNQTVEIYSEPENIPEIPIDQAIMWQVVQNLLSNANRYALKDSVVTVRIVQKDTMFEYSVADKGIGIPESEKGKIFEKFYRAENALLAVPEGSGLGLSLVRSLVQGWGGEIWFESQEGQGTTFFFTIPLKGMEKKEGEVSITI